MLPLIVGAVEDKSGADGAGAVVMSDTIEDVELITDPPEDGPKAEEPAKP
jgi:HemY protein